MPDVHNLNVRSVSLLALDSDAVPPGTRRTENRLVIGTHDKCIRRGEGQVLRDCEGLIGVAAKDGQRMNRDGMALSERT